MDEVEWRIEISERLAKIEANLENIKSRLPQCEKHKFGSNIKTNRRLIFLILFTYIPLVITLFVSVIN